MLKYNQKQLATILRQNQVIFAWLFGSQVTGRIGPLSDIDIAVYFKNSLNKKERFNLRLNLMHELGVLFQHDKVDVVPLNDSYPLLTHRVLKYGQLIFCTDPKKEKEFEDKAIGEYLDWQPVLEEQTKTTFN